MGLDCLWTTIFLGDDLEAWIKLFEGWRGGKSGLVKQLPFEIFYFYFYLFNILTLIKPFNIRNFSKIFKMKRIFKNYFFIVYF